MAFKMKGFNPGKGTGMGNGFSRVELNPNTRDDPNAAEYIEWFTNKYGYPPSMGNPEGMGGATVDNETREDVKQKKKDSETNEMMFEDLTNRLEEYRDDPLKVEVGPMEAYYPTSKETGKKMKPPKGMFRDWMRRNADVLSDMPGVNVELDKNGRIVRATGPLQAMFDKKINEAINIDNDLKMSAEQGYGFNEEQLQDFGVYGMDEFGFNPNVFGGGDYVTTQGLDVYAPNPQKAGNIERNQANLDEIKRQENAEQRFNFAKNNLDRSIRQGNTPSRSTIKAIKETDPEYYESVLEPYLNMDKKQEKNWDNAWADGEVYDASKGGGIRAWERHLNPQKLKDTKDPIRPGESVSVDAPTQEDDAILADMDKMIAEQEQEQNQPGYLPQTPVEEPPVEEEVVEKPPVEEEVAIGGGEGENIVEETETKEQEFDPRDTNKDGNVDRWEEKAAKRAAMFAKKEEYDSAYAKWNNKNLENMAKQTLMNADVNPFKFGSKEHEEYTNNKSRAKGLAIKQRYNKFL